jgi:hypothetical protein
VPVRLLPRWAAVLGRLRPNIGASLWITSLVAHLEAPTYGDQLRPAVDGHILQVFDTGTPLGDRARVARLAARAAMPYRLGVGAFERVGTEHRAWFAHLDEACARPWCDTVWVFPGNQPWTQLVEQG